MSEEVLNRDLYRTLRSKFGDVRVHHRGEAMAAVGVPARADKGPYLVITHSGEYYAIDCPFCNDRRKRLYINHRYGQRDEFGRRMHFLAICYNDTACMSRYENQLDFREMLGSTDEAIERFFVDAGVEVPLEAQEIDWPGPCTRLDALAYDHPACEYLRSRGFDPVTIGRLYGAAYCHGSHYRTAADRIIIPVYERGKLKGWQARYVGELNWKDKSANHPPKYFTYPGMPRRLLLYNLGRARHYATGVIVEGVTDVWNFGGMAVCTFGSSMSLPQLNDFHATFRRRSGILLYDPEAFESSSTRRIIDFFESRMPGRFAAVKLPEGVDPGSMDRAVMRDYVAAEAEDQGVKVEYARWSR